MKRIKVMLSCILLITILSACQNDSPPSLKTIIAMISKASLLSTDFEISPMNYNNEVCISLAKPQNVKKYEQLRYTDQANIFCEAQESQTTNPIRYQDWVNQVETVYGGEALAKFLGFVPKLPVKEIPIYVHDDSKLWVNTNLGGRGSSLGLVQEWHKATLIRRESFSKESDSYKYQFILPYYNDHEESESLSEEEKAGKIEKEIELIRTEDGWRLNTLIDTLGR
jgi:hypothetical protein